MNFKAWSLSLLVLLVGLNARSEESSLREHMSSMGVIMDKIWAQTNDPADWPVAANKVQDLRQHLVKAIAFLPPKINDLEGSELRLATVLFHQYMARAIWLTASIEKALLEGQIDPNKEGAEREVHDLLRELSVVVGKGHGQFR